MRSIFRPLVVLSLLCQSLKLLSQKPAIDFSAIDRWPEITSEQISNNGEFVSYQVSCSNCKPVLHLNTSDGSNVTKIERGTQGVFTSDSKYFVYKAGADTMCILNLETRETVKIPEVESFDLSKNGYPNWIVYKAAGQDTLTIMNIQNGDIEQFPNIVAYQLSATGKNLLLQQGINSYNSKLIQLGWLDLETHTNRKVWVGAFIAAATFDGKETRLAFIAKAKGDAESPTQVWCYEPGWGKARLFASDTDVQLENRFKIGEAFLNFNPAGNRIFVDVKPLNILSALPNAVSVDIWNYKDQYTQEDQLRNSWKYDRPYRAMINIEKGQIVILEKPGDGTLQPIEISNNGDGQFALVSNDINLTEGDIYPNNYPDVYLVDVNSGTRKTIKKQLPFASPSFSPSGKYVLWYDEKEKNYFTYNVQSGVIKNISSKIHNTLYDELWDEASYPGAYGTAAWLEDDGSLLVYDRYDIWKVDPSGMRDPVNVTKGYGRRNNTILRLVYGNGKSFSGYKAIKADSSIVLCSFNERTKANGFFQLNLNDADLKMLLAPSAAQYYFSANFKVEMPGFIKKALNDEKYLIKVMSATEFPNLYVTKDFKKFIKISQLAPQKNYNWFTSELFHWTTMYGNKGEGILYKPENFDSTKRYPLILYCYEKLSPALNQFITPETSQGAMNIPWFVSNGYLVFCPDIYYEIGNPSKGIFEYVVSAAENIRRKKYVDPGRIGIQGHSWGGFEVNQLLTQTNLFTAAASAAGISDMVSHFGQNGLCFGCGPAFVERYQNRMASPLSETRSSYINNSPVFHLKNVTTPLLLMHNKRDENVHWSQSVEMFNGLRRLNKKVWLLQYDAGIHNVRGDASLDYSIRLGQFFDHYLKHKPAPGWMTRGIPAQLKRIASGYNFDLTGNCGTDCEICIDWNDKYLQDSTKIIDEVKTLNINWSGDTL